MNKPPHHLTLIESGRTAYSDVRSNPPRSGSDPKFNYEALEPPPHTRESRWRCNYCREEGTGWDLSLIKCAAGAKHPIPGVS